MQSVDAPEKCFTYTLQSELTVFDSSQPFGWFIMLPTKIVTFFVVAVLFDLLFLHFYFLFCRVLVDWNIFRWCWFYRKQFSKDFHLSLCSPSVFVSLLLFLLGVDADDVFMVVKLFFNFHCLYRYAFAFYSWPSIL